MEERKTFFDFWEQTFSIFGITIVMMTVLCRLFGEEAEKVSTMFRLGNQGIPWELLLQFLIISLITTAVRFALWSERLAKRLSVFSRFVLMLLGVVTCICTFIVVNQWFPLDMWQPWVLFFLLFAVCFAVSMGVMVLKTRSEDKKLEESLAKMKENQRASERKEDEI